MPRHPVQVVSDRATGDVLFQFPDGHGQYSPHPGTILQIRSTDGGESWGAPIDVSKMLGPAFSPFAGGGLAVGPGAGIQLSPSNPFHPNRLLFAGHHGA